MFMLAAPRRTASRNAQHRGRRPRCKARSPADAARFGNEIGVGTAHCLLTLAHAARAAAIRRAPGLGRMRNFDHIFREYVSLLHPRM